MWLYKFLIYVFKAFSRLQGVRFYNRQNVPGEGPLVVIGNHRCWSDIALMALAVYPRQVHFMAKSEYSKNRILGFLIKYLGSFMVERGEADIKAVKTSLGYLKKGEVVGIFPEGTRNREDGLLPFKEGAFMIASRGKAKILPLAIRDAEAYAKFGKPRSSVDIGECFELGGFLDERNKFDAKAAATYSERIIEKKLNEKTLNE